VILFADGLLLVAFFTALVYYAKLYRAHVWLKKTAEDQRKTIEMLNDALGGKGTLTTDNLTRIARLEAELDAKQAKIDALMLEYCPDEMTPEQLAEWGRHQKVADVKF